jgi:uncharacterized YkwD family protein
MRKETKFMSRLIMLFLFSVFLFSVFSVPVQAQVKELTYRTATIGSDVVKIKPMEKASQIYEFMLNEKVVMRYRTMSQGLSAQERALAIWERANRLGKTLKEGIVAVDCIKGNFVVTIEDQLFITVTEDDFKANNSTGKGLAKVWAENLRRAKKPTPDKTVQDKPAQDKFTEETQQQQELDGVNAEEVKMLELINAERAKVGVKPLKLDPQLVKIARIKSQEMIEKNYFNHTSPTYGDPFSMMKKFGIEYGYAGENLAGNPSVENAHESLMASPGHKKNILSPNYTHVGIGIIEGGPYGKMFTQLFISQQ